MSIWFVDPLMSIRGSPRLVSAPAGSQWRPGHAPKSLTQVRWSTDVKRDDPLKLTIQNVSKLTSFRDKYFVTEDNNLCVVKKMDGYRGGFPGMDTEETQTMRSFAERYARDNTHGDQKMLLTGYSTAHQTSVGYGKS